ncbi:MAG: nucleotide sugar dehydrogenase [Gemmataceae bacterium]
MSSVKRAVMATMSPLAEKALARIQARTARVAVVGLGYVGLPLAETFAWGGYPVLGFDIDADKIERLRRGESYIGHIDPERVAELNASGRFDPTDDPGRFVEVDAIVICVPTPLGSAREPDLSYIESTGRTLMPHLRQGQLIVLESSTYPGTTEEVLQPILEESGLVAGKDFFLAYSPEREDPGNRDFATRNIPKVVGGLDEASKRLAVALYEPIVEGVVPVSSIRVAEACKILENTYRAVNIALVNELKGVFTRMGIDVWEVIEAAKTKPFGYQAFYPGPGLGGHCIPIDPFYLTWAARRLGLNTRFIELAGEVNTAMPQFVLDRLAEALNEDGKPIKGSRICVLGVAYKKDVDDPRESPAFPILEALQARGAQISYSDPHVPTLPRMRHHPTLRMDSQALTPAFLAQQDAVLIVTDHAKFDYESVLQHARLVVDTRNATKDVRGGRARIVKA